MLHTFYLRLHMPLNTYAKRAPSFQESRKFANYELCEGNQKFTLAVLNAHGCRWPERMSTLKMKEIP